MAHKLFHASSGSYSQNSENIVHKGRMFCRVRASKVMFL